MLSAFFLGDLYVLYTELELLRRLVSLILLSYVEIRFLCFSSISCILDRTFARYSFLWVCSYEFILC